MKSLLFNLKPISHHRSFSLLLFIICILGCRDESIPDKKIVVSNQVPTIVSPAKSIDPQTASHSVTSVTHITPPGLTILGNDSLKDYDIYETHICLNADCSESKLISREIIPKKKKWKDEHTQ